jgi:hypothetical protein
MSIRPMLLFIATLAGCSPQMASLAPSMTSQAANLLFEQERLQQEATLQREQKWQQQQLYLQYLQHQNQQSLPW